MWGIEGTGDFSFLLIQFSSLHFTGDQATIGGHAGSLGSLLTLSSFTMYKFIFAD
jgi:hypothetical protein